MRLAAAELIEAGASPTTPASQADTKPGTRHQNNQQPDLGNAKRLRLGCREVPRAFRTVHPLADGLCGKVNFLPRPKKSFSPEFKDEAVKMVMETSRPIAKVGEGARDQRRYPR